MQTSSRYDRPFRSTVTEDQDATERLLILIDSVGENYSSAV